MALAGGSRLGPYEILAPLGAGGMGEVYKARDTRLQRTVALKVLPDHVSQDVEARQRFEREAQTIASLNHPHICVLHDVGRERPAGEPAPAMAVAQPVDFLVMEYLEGVTLAQRLADGPLPPEQATAVAVQIADALERAHTSGIMHRDLKPANIFLLSGDALRAKLLDFGLAKPTAAVRSAPASGSGATLAVTAGATVSSPATTPGMILGTFPYMAPEQIEGQEVDARTDIFAFGAVLYEMFTGRRAFQGSTHTSTMAAILATDPPPPSTLAPVSPRIDHIIRRCLEKIPAQRWQSIRDVALELQSASDPRDPLTAALTRPAVAASAPRPSRRMRLVAAAAATVLIALSAAAGRYLRTPADDSARSLRFEIPAGGIAQFMAVSPDGGTIAYAAPGSDGASTIWVRPLGTLEPRALAAGGNPDWSPDSRFLLFTGPDSTLKRIDVNGGPPQTVARLRAGVGYQRAAWGSEDVIVYSSGGSLYQVPASGGEPLLISQPDASLGETAHATPSFLPDGRRFLYTAWGRIPENRAVYVAASHPADSSEPVDLERGRAARVRVMPAESKAIYAKPGYLLFLRGRTLVARPFDADRLAFTGDARPVAENIVYNPASGAAAFSVSDGGTLIYRRAEELAATGLNREWRWATRSGQMSEPIGERHGDTHVALSHDATRIAFSTSGEQPDIWVYDIARGVKTRLTSHAAVDALPVWSPDDRRLVFASTREAAGQPQAGGASALQRADLYHMPANGAVAERLLLAGGPGVQLVPVDWSADGKWLVATRILPNDADRNRPLVDLWVVPPDGGEAQEYLSTAFFKVHATISPNGRWLAYATDESGTWQVVVQPFPDPSGGKWQISTNGGLGPRWRRDGRELYYLNSSGELMAVPVVTDSQFDFRVATPLFQTSLPFTPGPNLVNVPYAVADDGQRFLMSLPIAAPMEQRPITVITHWSKSLTQ